MRHMRHKLTGETALVDVRQSMAQGAFGWNPINLAEWEMV